ncbi:MAG: DNA polymerase I [bacterium]|nr:DNA polymerase I [bacterium]MDZ4248450.1 DNA polymerase I [Patescibacteria group bacterium]
MPAPRPKLVLIDAHALIHRAFHAIPFLAKRDGELTNAVYGFTATVLSVLKELRPEYVAVSFDLPEPTFRHKKYEDYKATRQKAPDELRSQFGRVREVVDALGMPVFEQAGYEADDVLGSLAKQFSRKHDLDAYIVTGDKDTLQLVDDRVRIFTLRKGIKDTVIYDPERLKEETGLTPEEFVEYKALKGDPSDNIPGVPGIGDKTATILVQKYRDLEGLYKILGEDPAKHPDIKPKVRANLAEFKEQAFLSRELSLIVTDLKLKFNLKDCTIHDFDVETALKLFKEMEFSSLVPRMKEAMAAEGQRVNGEAVNGKPSSATTAPSKPRDFSKADYRIVRTEAEFKKFLAELKQQPVFAFDTETDTLDAIRPVLVGMSFSWRAGSGWYLPVGHRDPAGHKKGPNLPLRKTLAALKSVLTAAEPKIVCHHLKYDYQVMRAADGVGLELGGLAFDTLFGSYLLNPGARTLGLDKLAYQELGYEMQPITELIGTGKDQTPVSEVPVEALGHYAAEDADITWQLYEKFSDQLEQQGLSSIQADLELPLAPVLGRMEQRGVKIDTAFLSKMSDVFGKRLAKIEKAVCKLAGHEFNLASPRQLAAVLFDELQLAKGTRTQSGAHASTAAGKIEKLRDAHPIVPLILEHRELSKLKGTYLDALPNLVRKDTGRLHTSFNQTVAATGRLSSSDPNLQNIPVRTEVGREIRKAFVAGRGCKLISADYSQFELRIAAHISGDAKLSEQFREGKDIHTATAAAVAGVAEADVTPEQRYAAKAVNFSILYGATPHGVARSTGMPVTEAKEYIDRYFRTYPKIRDYMDEMIAKVRTDGYVETLFGRRRYLPEINSSSHPIRESAKRMAINMPIQGTQADILKLAMIQVDAGLAKVSKDAHLLLTVHDELVLEAPTKDIPKVAKFVVETMRGAYALDVPIEVEAKVGPNWGELQPTGGPA